MILQNPIGVIERLQLVINSRRIPAKQRELGEQLLVSLKNTVRIAFIGRHGSSKANLVGMMLGRDDIPRFGNVATTEITYGPVPRITLTRTDGTFVRLDGLFAETDHLRDVIHSVVELPDDSLQQLTYVETNLTGTPDQQQRLFQGTIETCQVCVWCSEYFDRDELSLWRTAPDRVKDHSFLVLTKSDHDHEKGDLARGKAELDDIVSEQFLDIYPVAASKAATAPVSGTRRRQELRGAKDLFDGIEAQVQLGRMEDIDMATLLINRYSDTSQKSATPRDHQPVPKRPALQPFLGTLPKTSGTGGSKSTLDASLFDQVHARLRRCAESMLKGMSSGGVLSSASALGQCAETVTDLSEMLEGSDAGTGRITDFLKDVREAEEVLLLLQFENSEDAAEDAVSLMLQLAKEISDREYA